MNIILNNHSSAPHYRRSSYFGFTQVNEEVSDDKIIEYKNSNGKKKTGNVYIDSLAVDLIKVENGKVVYPTYGEAVKKQKKTQTGAETLTSKKNIEKEKFLNTAYPPYKGDPNNNDWDGDGLPNDMDPEPDRAFDNRFEIVDNYNADPYKLFPEHVINDYEVAYNDWYNSEYQQAKRNNDTEKMKGIEKEYENDILKSKVSKVLGLVAGSSGRNLKTHLDGNIEKNEVIDLGNSIADYYIGYSRGGRYGFYTCMNLFLNSAEQTVYPGHFLSISAKNKDYLIPGSVIVDVNDNLIKSFFQKKLPKSFDEIDILCAISAHDHSITAKNVECIEKNGEICYSANVKFYLLDLYDYTTEDWAPRLQKSGLSEPYLMSACKEMKISWKKGQRFPEYDSYTDVILRDEYTRDWQPNSSKIKGVNLDYYYYGQL